MLKEVVTFIREVGFEINNVDLTIMAETPKLSSYKDAIRRVIASVLEIKPIKVNIKATTTEKLGFVGRKEGVAVEAACSLYYFNWKKI
jgi:2-C-methyl-D-erythritol 4-phosphate cytidylyltransferase/2-C-methyl-D-erythritol 2,4-cyclodiphosphate synthase